MKIRLVLLGLILVPFSYFDARALETDPQKTTVLVPESEAELRQAATTVVETLEREHQKNPQATLEVGLELVPEATQPAASTPRGTLPLGTRVKMGLVQFALNGTGIFIGMKFQQGADSWQALQVGAPLGLASGLIVLWGDQYFRFISRPKSELAKRALWWATEATFLGIGIGLKALGGLELPEWQSVLGLSIALPATMGLLGQGGAELSIAERMFEAIKRDPGNGRMIRFKAQIQRFLASAISTTLTVAFPDNLVVILALGGAGETIRQLTLRRIKRLRCAENLAP